jgi:hypothetical protein
VLGHLLLLSFVMNFSSSRFFITASELNLQRTEKIKVPLSKQSAGVGDKL